MIRAGWQQQLRRVRRTLRQSHRRNPASWVIVFSLAVIAGLGVTGWNQSRTHRLIDPSGVVTYSTDHPDESPVPASYHSTSTGAQPAYIRLPSIGAAGFVQRVGVDQHHQLAVPTNIHLAAWYVNSVLPGNNGLSIIDGHIDGPKYPGIFEKLATLKVGDHYELDLANGAKQTYEVSQIQTLPLAAAVNALFSQSPGITKQLNLITCGGTFNKALGMYDKRVVVVSQFVSQS